MSNRKTCTACGKKLYTKYLQQVYYKLLHRYAYHCIDCMSRVADNLQLRNISKNLHLIELFSGSKTLSTIAEREYNFTAQTLDINPKYNPSICSNITTVKISHFHHKKEITLVWASIPCTVYSTHTIHKHWEKITVGHRHYYYIPKSNAAIEALRILHRVMRIIRQLNPTIYVIENPRGALRHMPLLKAVPFRHTISYHDYGLPIYKPTDIFTNLPGLQLKKLKSCVSKTFPSSVASLTSSFTRSLLPPQLCHTILRQVCQHIK